MSDSDESERATIVVVNDDPEYLDLARRVLEGEGYRVLTTVAAVGYRTVKETMPDLVILEVVSPDLPEWHLLTMLKLDHDTAKIPVVVCTDGARALDREAVWLRAHGGELLLKPFGRDDLLAKVRPLASSQRSEPRTPAPGR